MSKIITWTCLLIILSLTTRIYAQDNLEESLIGHWCLDGNAIDNSINNHDGTIQGAQSTTDRFGQSNSAFDFDGINDEIVINHSFEELNLPFTVSAWIYKHDATQIKHIFSTSSQPTIYSGIYFSVYSDEGLRISYGDGGPEGSFSRRTKISNDKVPLNTWVLVMAVVRGPTDMSLYINCEDAGGYYDGTGGTMQHSTEPARIGRATHENFWGGKIDDLRLYNRDLTAEEIDILCDVETCEGDYCYSDPPEVSSPIEICSTELGEVEVYVDGSNLSWYDDPSLSNLINSSNSFYPDEPGKYYITQTLEWCESEAEELEITLNTTDQLKVDQSIFYVCDTQMGNFEINLTGSNLNWYSDESLSKLINSGNSFFPETAGNYFVTQSIDNCESEPIKLEVIKIDKAPQPTPVSSTMMVCPEAAINLTLNGSNLTFYNDFELTSEIDPTNYTPDIEHKIYVTQTIDGCTSLPSELIIQFEQPDEPKANFDDYSVCVGSTISVEGENIKWYDKEMNLLREGTNEIVANSIGEKEFYVTQTLNSCESYPLQLDINVFEFVTENLTIPNAFSPNHDNINDSFYWIPTEAEACLGSFKQVLIMDRRGQSIFESNDITFQWEPFDLHGSYYYIIEFDSTSFKGNIQIVK